jgi:hypothetical protein
MVRKPLRSTYHALNDIKFLLRKKWLYRNTDVASITKKSWATLITGDHNFQMKVYHSYPDFQVKQLDETEFKLDSAFDKDGGLIDPLNTKAGGMIYYLCQGKQ